MKGSLRVRIAAAIIVAVLAALPFLRAVQYGIVNLDDYYYVAWHDQVLGGLGWDGVKFAFTCLDESIWMPFTWISYMFDWSLANLLCGSCGICTGLPCQTVAFRIMHMHSILIHALNAALVWLVLREVADFGMRGSGDGRDADA